MPLGVISEDLYFLELRSCISHKPLSVFNFHLIRNHCVLWELSSFTRYKIPFTCLDVGFGWALLDYACTYQARYSTPILFSIKLISVSGIFHILIVNSSLSVAILKFQFSVFKLILKILRFVSVCWFISSLIHSPCSILIILIYWLCISTTHFLSFSSLSLSGFI